MCVHSLILYKLDFLFDFRQKQGWWLGGKRGQRPAKFGWKKSNDSRKRWDCFVYNFSELYLMRFNFIECFSKNSFHRLIVECKRHLHVFYSIASCGEKVWSTEEITVFIKMHGNQIIWKEIKCCFLVFIYVLDLKSIPCQNSWTRDFKFGG